MSPPRSAIPIPLCAQPRATLTALRRIVWRESPPHGDDVPPIVRAGSALRRWRGRWIVVQDDIRALAAIDTLDARAANVEAVPLLLPSDERGTRTFDDVRGNKRSKLDLEAAVVLPDGRLLVLGSGSTRARERVVLLAPDGARVVDATALYAWMRECAHLNEREMNIEAAVVIGDRMRAFQRAVGLHARGEVIGTVAPRAVRDAKASMTFDLDLTELVAWLDHDAALPYVTNVTRYDLGRVENAVIGFTDAALQRDGSVAFLACAELTGDPTVDGRVVATRFGVLDGAAGWQSEIVDERGERVLDKLEGLEPAEEPGCFHVVSDADDPATPARIARLVVGSDDGLTIRG